MTFGQTKKSGVVVGADRGREAQNPPVFRVKTISGTIRPKTAFRKSLINKCLETISNGLNIRFRFITLTTFKTVLFSWKRPGDSLPSGLILPCRKFTATRLLESEVF